MENISKVDFDNFAKLLTITEYADECGVVRNTIHTRIKHKTRSLGTVKSEAKVLYKLMKGEAHKAEREQRPKLWKAVLDAVAKDNKYVTLINIVDNPPGKRKTGRPIVIKKEVGTATKKAMKYAEDRGYTLVRKSLGYQLSTPSPIKGEDDFVEHFRNLPQVYTFLDDNPEVKNPTKE